MMSDRKNMRVSEAIIREYGFSPEHAMAVLNVLTMMSGVRQRPITKADMREIELDFDAVESAQRFKNNDEMRKEFSDLEQNALARLGNMLDVAAEMQGSIHLLGEIAREDTLSRSPYAWIKDDVFIGAYVALVEFALETLPQDLSIQIVGRFKNKEELRNFAGSLGLCMHHITQIDFSLLQSHGGNTMLQKGTWPTSKPHKTKGKGQNRPIFSPSLPPSRQSTQLPLSN